jgi:hypothetical protein
MEVNNTLQRIGDIFVCDSDDATAHSLFLLMLENFTIMGIHQGRGNCMVRIGIFEVWRARR